MGLTYNPMLTCRSKYHRMSFNVTQCPACESTFNTNSRVLAAAAGRVRCGACLNVFEAIDNFLIPEEADTAPDQGESVFVGNDPQEFFDPSSFLTRSALSEAHGNEAERSDPIDERNLHQELERSETVNADFFATVAGELQGRAGALPLEDPPEDEEQQIELSEDLQTSITNDSIDAEFEEEILDSFAAQASEADELTENDSANSSFEEPNEAEAALTEAESSHTTREGSFLNSSLSASFSFDPRAYRKPQNDESESDTSPTEEAASEPPVDSNITSDVEAELIEDNEELLPDTHIEALASDTQIASDATSSQMQEETSQTVATEQETTESFPSAEIDTAPEPDRDLAAVEESPLVEDELPDDETDNLLRQEEPPGETVAEFEDKDEEPIIEAPQRNTAEADEESTEAIRARALEAELSDEEALEAIPRENLAALGSMSTPVELLARKESRLLRNSLLFLSILLLGGLLASQYLWQRMELYSQLPQLRPLYEIACIQLNCTLPEYTDIDSIRSENLTVQTHPTLANGLMVNTVIRNTAAFEQPFPILILSFNSSENSVIALREFTAAEYLDPGLRSIQAMPAKTPVQIGLAIMDPGSEAINYTLAFRWP